jgi:hypothetical protein
MVERVTTRARRPPVDLDVERNVLTVTAQRPTLNEGQEFLALLRSFMSPPRDRLTIGDQSG